MLTGNPVRPAVREAADDSVSGPRARRAVPPARLRRQPGRALPRRSRARRVVAGDRATCWRWSAVVQQCRPEDMERVRDAYAQLGVEADLAPFFADMPKRIADSHLVVSRSGASTCAELAVIGRPAILVPLPGALDQDQTANAKVLANAGGGFPDGTARSFARAARRRDHPVRRASRSASKQPLPPPRPSAGPTRSTGSPISSNKWPRQARGGQEFRHEGAQGRHRAGAFHRHRRHRHERHRRGAGQSRPSGPGL